MSFDNKSKNPFRGQQDLARPDDDSFLPPYASGAAEEFYPRSETKAPQSVSNDVNNTGHGQWRDRLGGESGGAQTLPSYYSQPDTACATSSPRHVDPNQVHIPKSFSSHQPNFSHNPFPPIYLIANGKSLSSGFPSMPPPSSPEMPHPFETHDVNERDWTSFLGEIASLGGGQHAQTHSSGGLAKLVGTLLHGLTGPPPGSAGPLIDQWNDRFFHPRKMEVILAQGPVKLSGPRDGRLPVLNREQERAHRQRSGSRSSSSSSSSDDERHSHGDSHHTVIGGRRERRTGRREYKRERREDRHQRRAQRREGRRAMLGLGGKSDHDRTDQKYRLFVVSL
jgi:hypothetical protein